MSWELLDWSIIGPALCAGLLILSIHVPLGQMVLERGIIFIDLAIAQIAGLGVIAAEVLFGVDHGWPVQLAAVSAALLAAIGLHWAEKRWSRIQEALIGTLFVLAATGSILLLAENPHGGEHLKDLLVGQILWSTWPSLLPIAVLYALLLGIWSRFPALMKTLGFYVVFAFAITASVQVVGVYLVFASLIIPALTTIHLQKGKRLLVGYSIGAIAYLLGIVLSAVWDLPTGAIIVWCMAITGLVTASLLNRPAGQEE